MPFEQGAGLAKQIKYFFLCHLSPVSPALGGIVIGQEVGRAMQVRAIFAERQDGKLVIRRGFTLAPSDRVVVIEDVITTGGSALKAVEVIRAAGASILGVLAVVDREEGGREAIEAAGLQVTSIARVSEILPLVP